VVQRTGREPFVAVDQEGGTVARLRRGAHEVPSMMALGAAGDADLAQRVGAEIAADLTRAGIDVNLAPVVDLALYPRGTTIGLRSFGDRPEAVAGLGAALIRGLQSGGIAATLKHFPGHGSTADDSHDALPAIDTDAATLRERDLVPFLAGVRAGARAVMTAHIVVRAWDSARPATLSARVLGDLLRGELGFRGACLTDCMEMDAIARTVGTVRGCVLALQAGADCVLVSHRLSLARESRSAIVAAVLDGSLPLERLAEASRHVAALRCRDAGAPAAASRAPSAEDPGAEAARRAITLIRAAASALPVRGNAIVVSFEGEPATGARDTQELRPSLSLALRERRVRSESYRVPVDPSPEHVAHLVEAVQTQAERVLVLVARRAHVYGGQRTALAALLALVPDAILVSALEPFDVALFPAARTVLCTYGDGQPSIDAVADVLAGRREAEGVLPVRIGATCPS